jgi:hypothetical protein
MRVHRLVAAVCLLAVCAASAAAQTVTVVRDVNLRSEQSSAENPIRLLKPDEPPMTLLEPLAQDGYYHVRTTANEEGYVWSRNVKISTVSPATTPNPPPPAPTPPPPAPAPAIPAGSITLGTGVPGSASMVGCGDGLWAHVYNPTRLLVQQDCVTITGTIIDATANQSKHQADGVRHEGDGDTHGWLQVDAPSPI